MIERMTQVVEMKTKPGKRTLVIWGILAGLAVFLAANAHLVYVAMMSDPDCVITKSGIGTSDKVYRPVKSGC